VCTDRVRARVRVHVRVFKKKSMSPFLELHVEIFSVLIPVHEALRHTSTTIIFPCACTDRVRARVRVHVRVFFEKKMSPFLELHVEIWSVLDI